MDDKTPLRIIRPPDWRTTKDGGVELHDQSRDAWQRIKPWSAPLLESLVDGTDYPTLLALARTIPVSKDPVKAEMRLKLFLYSLHRLGHVALPRPPPAAHLRYEHLNELGRGGVAVADLVRDRQSGQELAMKRAWDFLQPYDVTEQAIRHEVEVLRALDHPNIVRLHDTFETGGHVHLVREAVQGDEFTIYRGRGADLDHMGSLATGVLDLLGHIHGRGYLLIDLRPANFFRRADGTPVLLDVGQCRAHTDGHLQLEKRIGSRGFLSPEMEAGTPLTFASDLYGFGLLLVYLRTGQLPRRKIRRDKLARHLQDDPWAPVILALIEPDLAARPQDVPATVALLPRPTSDP